MKILVKYYQDFGRSGELDGLFITTKEDLEKIYNQTVYFGEVLGKHSEISSTMQPKYFEIKSEDQDFIQKLEDLLGTSISGYNPFDYLLPDFFEEEQPEED